MRIATAATASLFSLAVISGIAEIGSHGFPFFVFRPAVGESAPTVPTDQQFLAKEAAAAHHVVTPTHHVTPKGRHHKKHS
jgi:hypothetical protein